MREFIIFVGLVGLLLFAENFNTLVFHFLLGALCAISAVFLKERWRDLL